MDSGVMLLVGQDRVRVFDRLNHVVVVLFRVLLNLCIGQIRLLISDTTRITETDRLTTVDSDGKMVLRLRLSVVLVVVTTTTVVTMVVTTTTMVVTMVETTTPLHHHHHPHHHHHVHADLNHLLPHRQSETNTLPTHLPLLRNRYQRVPNLRRPSTMPALPQHQRPAVVAEVVRVKASTASVDAAGRMST